MDNFDGEPVVMELVYNLESSFKNHGVEGWLFFY